MRKLSTKQKRHQVKKSARNRKRKAPIAAPRLAPTLVEGEAKSLEAFERLTEFDQTHQPSMTKEFVTTETIIAEELPA